MSIRKQRLSEFGTLYGGVSTISGTLIGLSREALHSSLLERKGNGVRTSKTHCSNHAVGAVILIVCAFEAWLNEIVLFLTPFDPTHRSLAEEDVVRKFCDISKRFGDGKASCSEDLQLAVTIRNDLVHYLSRSFSTNAIPSWYENAKRRGPLLCTPQEMNAQFTLGQSFHSHRLAEWTWCTIQQASVALCDSQAGNEYAILLRALRESFLPDDNVQVPADLTAFDKANELTLTWTE